jgi:hypothetical protein
MFKVGDRVKIITTVFQEAVGTVVRVIPGRARVIPREFVVHVAGGSHSFFEDQLVFMNEGLTPPGKEVDMVR